MDNGQSTHPVTVLVLLHFCTSTCFPMFYSCALISRSISWLNFERKVPISNNMFSFLEFVDTLFLHSTLDMQFSRLGNRHGFIFYLLLQFSGMLIHYSWSKGSVTLCLVRECLVLGIVFSRRYELGIHELSILSWSNWF